MSESVLKALRKNREGRKEIDGIIYIYRRPTDAEAIAFSRQTYTQVDMCRDFVIGWENVTEDSIVKNGCHDAVEFSKELWADWLNDCPSLWVPLSNVILESYSLHIASMADATKK